MINYYFRVVGSSDYSLGAPGGLDAVAVEYWQWT